MPEADVEVGGRRYGVVAHDWRRTGLEAWFELMEARELADEPAGGAPPPLPPPGLALSQAEFAGAVRAALRDLRRPEALAGNPLAVARVVRDRSAGDPVAEVLERSGHWPFVDDLETVTAAITSFLDRHAHPANQTRPTPAHTAATPTTGSSVPHAAADSRDVLGP